ncbi:hypothetical protein CXB51_005174 [Gossypium anomalum]|uniref:RNase H type-1 domain-containing protein n=1 Tax=Gossypium anomalum TaxID=47600 RepID=A0A8J5Z0H3_9ROSI|nr:hypothetical protein CXB51_005174 [Gossypium anomalum]
MEGICWKVGRGTNISVINDAWIPVARNFRLSSVVNNLDDFKVAELIDNNVRKWKRELIANTFSEEVAGKILSIPLAEDPHDDFLAWSREPSRKYSVRSAYKLLQVSENDPRAYALQTDYNNFYKKIWLLNLPSKTKITAWKISWNYLATRVNMQHRKLISTAICPRCERGTKTMDHLIPFAAEALAAEALACRKAVQIRIDMQWPEIIVEGDSLIVIKKCKAKRQDKSLIGAYIQDIQQLRSRSKNFMFEYTPRTVNGLAHILATETLKRKEVFFLVGSAPGYADNQREIDSVHEPD